MKYIYILIFHCFLQKGNKGAFIRFEAPDLKPNIITFEAVVSIFHNLKSVILYYLS